MNPWQAIFLGILQGITEFLPISSSGHLAIFQKLFSFSLPPLPFDVFLHFGSFFAIFFFFRKEIKRILAGSFFEIKEKKFGENLKFILKLVLASLPIAFFGVILKDRVEKTFASFLYLGIFYLFFGVFLFSTIFLKKEKKNGISFWKGILIGFFQVLSIFPGISRSGITVGGALFLGIDKKKAFSFSFFLGMIAILGATLFELPEILTFKKEGLILAFLGFFFSFISGIFSLKIFERVVKKGKLFWFGIYCFLVGIICFFLK